MSALKEWEEAKKKLPDVLLVKFGDNLAKELRETKILIKEAMSVIEMDLEGRVIIDNGSLLDRLRKATA